MGSVLFRGLFLEQNFDNVRGKAGKKITGLEWEPETFCLIYRCSMPLSYAVLR